MQRLNLKIYIQIGPPNLTLKPIKRAAADLTGT